VEDILLDTNVLSELARHRPDPKVVGFLADVTEPWLCSITFHELAYGAERCPDPKRQIKLRAWIEEIRFEFARRTIPIDDELAEGAGRLRALAAAQGRAVGVVDTLIAEAARPRGLRLATRNTRDFELLQVTLVNPWLAAK
jgi:hypothetical protein